ncbi:feruloyl esterase B-2 [Diaporthe amygdali]|uniref:feruloyl esterase B-2 n=1 Tax=Phomopsis amygdali TaxID=1214568 RepID=UPI0022FF130D|nr:feruloyl esterase B-2 [Diaporthe amygdali]KAJ0118868.1 feruloyl esterase B-2 [Diaporthe amygdali]
MGRKTRHRIRKKQKEARESLQRGFQVPPRSALPLGLYSSTRLTMPDRFEDVYSIVGSGVGKLSSRVNVASRHPVYLDEDEDEEEDDDDLSTVVSDTTFKPAESVDQPLENFNNEDDNNDDRTPQFDGSIDGSPFMINGKTISDADKFLTFEGVTNVGYIDGVIRQYLFDERFAMSDKDTDYAVWVKKNLIVAFQAHVLYEDCLTPKSYNNLAESKHRVMSQLQQDIGITAKHKGHCEILLSVLTIYKNARIYEIANTLQRGRLPQDPQDPLTSLLIELIDRYIMYNFIKTPLRSVPSKDSVSERVEQRSNTLRRTLADSSVTWRLFAELGSLIPSEERGLMPTRPWFYDTWVKANVADTIKPMTNLQTGSHVSKIALPIRQSQLDPKNIGILHASVSDQSKALQQKRKHDGDTTDQLHLESESTVVDIEVVKRKKKRFDAPGPLKKQAVSHHEH